MSSMTCWIKISAAPLRASYYGDILWFSDEKDAAVEQWSKALEMDSDNELLQRKVKDKTYYEE